MSLFKISANQTYLATVSVAFPSDPADKGKPKVNMFKARFKRVSQEELQSINERLTAKELDDRGLVQEVMVGWDGVADDEGNVAEFNDANLDALLSMFPTQPSICQTFFASIGGSKVKN